MEYYLICLAAALIGGLMLSRLTKLLKLPAVTAYLVAGLLLGPFCIGRLGFFGFKSLEQVESLSILTQTALGFIAFSRDLSPNASGGLTPFSPPSELQEIPVATREQSGLLASTRDECLSPRGASGIQPRDPGRPWRGTLASGHKPR